MFSSAIRAALNKPNLLLQKSITETRIIQASAMSSSDDRNILQKAVDKTKEVAGDAKEKITDVYHDIVGDNQVEDKAARSMKDTTDSARDKTKDLRENAGEKWENLKESAHEKKEDIKDKAQELKEQAQEKWENFREGTEQKGHEMERRMDASGQKCSDTVRTSNETVRDQFMLPTGRTLQTTGPEF